LDFQTLHMQRVNGLPTGIGQIDKRMEGLSVQFSKLSACIVFVITASLLAISTVRGNELPTPDTTSSAVLNSTTAGVAQLSPAYVDCGGTSAAAFREDYEQQVIDLVNQARADQNLPPFKRASALVEAARYHANDMLMDNYFQHPTYDRVDSNLVYVCDTFERIISYYSPDWRAMAENIAAGQTDPEWVMRAWMNSSGHRANILSSQTWEIGVGYAAGGAYSHYWVQDFGRREGVYPLIINREAASTDSRTVGLYIYGDWQFIRLRNDDDGWGDWQPFQSQLSWVLNNGAGEHTVWAEMMSDNQIAASQDSIELTESASVPSLENLPASVNFVYSIADGELYPPLSSIVPLNTGSSEVLEWTVSVDGSLFQVSPTSGVTPQAITIQPLDFPTDSTGTHQNTLTVTVFNPAEVLNSPQTVQLNLLVTNQPVSHLFLPVATR
jgi:uncharacterized protein YkwD